MAQGPKVDGCSKVGIDLYFSNRGMAVGVCKKADASDINIHAAARRAEYLKRFDKPECRTGGVIDTIKCFKPSTKRN